MGEITNRHRRIFRLQRAIVAAVTSAVLVLTGAAGAVQGVQNYQADQAAEVVSERADFWRVIAQEARPDSTTVDDKLAIDLRNAVGEIDASATSLPVEVNEFRAGPNEYGGIADKLGLNPFDNAGQSCEVCGSLSAEMKGNLLLIKQGQVDQVIEADAATVDADQGMQLTPFGMAVPVWFGLVYLTTTTAALVIAVRRDSKLNRYRPNMLNWDTQGGTQADMYRRFSKALSPLYFVTVLPLSRKLDKTKDYREVLEMTNLSETDRALREAREAIKQLPAHLRQDQAVKEKLVKIEELQAELARQIEHYDGDVPRLEAHADHLSLTSIDSLLTETADRLHARREALEELDGTSKERRQSATG